MQSASYLINRSSSLIENDCFDKALDLLNQAQTIVQKSKLENSEKSLKREGRTGSTSDEYLSTSKRQRQELDGLMNSQPVYVSRIPSIDGHSFLSFVIHFNLAMCHHLMAFRAVDHVAKHESLIGALKLYEAAASMQMEGSFQVDASYFMAMVNNSVHIYEMLHQPRQAKVYRDGMLESLTFLIAREIADTVDEFDSFVQTDTMETVQEMEASIVTKKTLQDSAASIAAKKTFQATRAQTKHTLQKTRAAIAA